MERPLADFAGERLVRKAPNQILALDAADQAYIRDSLHAIESAYGVAALPDVPIELMPGRTLMRLLVDLKAKMRPTNNDQREAWGRLAGAILILDTACSFANEHSKAVLRRLQGETPDPE
ncbi:hypothetical protein CU669_03770 [Paramagnetospirillum kuznetsovii]|uniref:Uncharacterized protein n=1 Tax=Paramagnetospirillum kuznetsovii TaxID=2053833 RepID=A0A364P2E6_9PROT|nr:hypothetical protein [Paramagnetospirillum kuznetsovii]RAU23275.1 hypothetical protein CU669_03770 [Paramagnetospirillum kuznetsovii]